MKPYYLTTPIYYASGEPHIGHAYTTILTDTLARYRRQTGTEVTFLTGTDEHGQKMKEASASKGKHPKELADEMAEGFKKTWLELDISFDRFIRTTEKSHVEFVQNILNQLWKNDQIYSDTYSGWYCIHEERYWTLREVGEQHLCPDCTRPVEYVEEKNYFFRMGNYQERLRNYIDENPDWIVPKTRRNEVLGFLKQPLEDLSISRPKHRLDWGITLPFDESHVCYVWVDALFSYVSGSNTGSQSKSVDNYCWPADLQVVGKDILTTHSVYWPTLLMASDLPLPQKILAHGWWLSEDTKMSKSLGNVIDPLELREKFGTDAVRWYLLRDMPTGSDATFTKERFNTRYEEIANVLGNLASRTISMIAKYGAGEIVTTETDTDLEVELRETLNNFQRYMNELQVHSALEVAMDLARKANAYIDKKEPWALARDPAKEDSLQNVLTTLHRVLILLTVLLSPVMPDKMSELSKRLGLSKILTFNDFKLKSGERLTVEKGDPLFPKDIL